MKLPAPIVKPNNRPGTNPDAFFVALIVFIIAAFLISGLSSCKSKPKEVIVTPAGFHLATAVDTLTLNKDNPGLVRVGDYTSTSTAIHKTKCGTIYPTL